MWSLMGDIPCLCCRCSHNTYLHGNQLVGDGGTEVITYCLRHGCRVVELDVYNEESKGSLANQGPQVQCRPGGAGCSCSGCAETYEGSDGVRRSGTATR